MATYQKTILSGSTDGKQIKITGTNTAGGVTIHTASATSGVIDEIWLYCYNNDSSQATLSIEWGTAGSTDHTFITPIPSQSGRWVVVEGEILQNGLIVKGFASVANKLYVSGYVNRITN